MMLVTANEDVATLLSLALAAHPELDEAMAHAAAASTAEHGATRGPLVPTIGAVASVGGLGGGAGTTAPGHDFDASSDYEFALN